MTITDSQVLANEANTPKRPLAQRAELARSRPVNYELAVELFLNTDGLSDTERAMLMGGACAKAYGWSPKKG